MVLQEAWIVFLEARGWFCKPTHGSAWQSGFPDLFISHKSHGPRWVEVKLVDMKGSKFTKAQLAVFPDFIQNGSPIWILTKVCEQEYNKLFTQPEGNYLEYLMMKRW